MSTSLSIGTETQYSQTSSESFGEDVFNQNGGGLLSFFTGSKGSKYATDLALRAFNDKQVGVAYYIIKDTLVVDCDVSCIYSRQDKSGKTLLHYLHYLSFFLFFFKFCECFTIIFHE